MNNIDTKTSTNYICLLFICVIVYMYNYMYQFITISFISFYISLDYSTTVSIY